MTVAPDRKRIGRWLAVGLIALLACGGYWRLTSSASPTPNNSAAGAPHGPRVAVVVATARKDDLPVYLSALGSVIASNTVTVRSRVDGELIRVAFEEGQHVHEGDLLAEIDPRPFEVQLTQAQGAMARDQAQLKVARATLARDRALFTQGIISQQELDTQIAQAGQFEGAIQADQGLIDNAQLQLTYARVLAPITGRAGLRLVDVGNIVHANDTNGLVVLTQLEPIAVLFSIPEDSLPAVISKLRGGDHPVVDAFDRAGQTRLASGTLLTADNQVDQTTGTTRLKAMFDNTDGALFPKQFVNVRLLLDVKHDAVVVPSAAIQQGPQGTFVYVVKQDNTVDVRPVKTSVTTGDDSAIDSGVSATETVVVDGVDKLRAGTLVEPKTASARAASEPSG
jgi:multidrug efflux system membrane fusion protein